MQTISLTLLVDLSASPAGATHLYRRKYTHWLVAMIGGERGEEYLDSSQGQAVEEFLIAQAGSCAAKVLRNLEQQAPELMSDVDLSSLLAVFTSGIVSLLEHSGEAERLAGLEALSIFASSSPRAFLFLLSQPSGGALRIAWLDLLRRQPSMQASTLHCVAQARLGTMCIVILLLTLLVIRF